MKEKIIKFFKSIKKQLKKFICFIIVPAHKKEGISQFILRQFLIPDSRGRASWTVSITAYVLVLIAIITFYEINMAVSMITTIHADGATSQAVRGFSTEFWGILGTLTIAITYLYRSRSKDMNGQGHNREGGVNDPQVKDNELEETPLLEQSNDTVVVTPNKSITDQIVGGIENIIGGDKDGDN